MVIFHGFVKLSEGNPVSREMKIPFYVKIIENTVKYHIDHGRYRFDWTQDIFPTKPNVIFFGDVFINNWILGRPIFWRKPYNVLGTKKSCLTKQHPKLNHITDKHENKRHELRQHI